jgi:hypothetical protein
MSQKIELIQHLRDIDNPSRTRSARLRARSVPGSLIPTVLLVRPDAVISSTSRSMAARNGTLDHSGTSLHRFTFG